MIYLMPVFIKPEKHVTIPLKQQNLTTVTSLALFLTQNLHGNN